MKRYVRSSIDIDATQEYANYLKRVFKEDPECSFRRTEPSSAGFIKEYVVSRKLTGKNIEMYVRKYDPETGASFGGGVTLVSGYWDVAQYMMAMGDDWERRQKELQLDRYVKASWIGGDTCTDDDFDTKPRFIDTRQVLSSIKYYMQENHR